MRSVLISVLVVLVISSLKEVISEPNDAVSFWDDKGAMEMMRDFHLTCKIIPTVSAILSKRLSNIKRSAWEVTTLENSIYVLGLRKISSKSDHSIRVFEDQNPFDFLKEIELEQIASPGNIVSSEKSKCLYVTGIDPSNDDRSIWIWKITPENDQVTKWLEIGNNMRLFSVTTEDHLLVLRNNPLSFVCQLEIYESDAKLIRNLSLSSDILALSHSIQKPNGNFIIIHQLRGAYAGQWVVSQMTNDGQLINRFIPRSKSEELKNPIHLSLDPDNDRLFLADHSGQRIILFDSNSLEWNKVLLTKEDNGIVNPGRLFYDRKNKQLMVVHEGGVDIYELKL